MRRAYRAHEGFTPGSLDALVPGDDDREIGDFVGTDDPAIERNMDMEAIRRHWHEMPGSQRLVLLLRFYGNMTQAQIADRLHCS